MMEAKIQVYGGGSYVLPPLLSWGVKLTGSVPCDSFILTCPYDASMAEILQKVWRVELVSGQIHLKAVLDEYEILQNEAGRLLKLSGRGLAALLLDNEAEAAEYSCPMLSEILRRHASPCRISWQEFREIRGREPYRVKSGSSQWKAISEFTRFAGGFEPRITQEGVLIAAPWQDDGKRLLINAHTPVLELKWKERRYGVLSEIQVVDKVRRTRQIVKNEGFLKRGGSCSRVLYTPRKSKGSLMRYTGAFQIAESEKHTRQLTAVIAGRCGGLPGEVVRFEKSDIGITGDFYIEESCIRGDTAGEKTTLIMRRLKQ